MLSHCDLGATCYSSITESILADACGAERKEVGRMLAGGRLASLLEKLQPGLPRGRQMCLLISAPDSGGSD